MFIDTFDRDGSASFDWREFRDMVQQLLTGEVALRQTAAIQKASAPAAAATPIVPKVRTASAATATAAATVSTTATQRPRLGQSCIRVRHSTLATHAFDGAALFNRTGHFQWHRDRPTVTTGSPGRSPTLICHHD